MRSAKVSATHMWSPSATISCRSSNVILNLSPPWNTCDLATTFTGLPHSSNTWSPTCRSATVDHPSGVGIGVCTPIAYWSAAIRSASLLPVTWIRPLWRTKKVEVAGTVMQYTFPVNCSQPKVVLSVQVLRGYADTIQWGLSLATFFCRIVARNPRRVASSCTSSANCLDELLYSQPSRLM